MTHCGVQSIITFGLRSMADKAAYSYDLDPAGVQL